ncbi:hypothetical protein BJ165DRAFT_1520444 [Panaeolus papilionaceus]|nr:hypothetical protein BJ165DRAFT_1520444 [Panaeolus papilionaceus]
MVYRRSLKLQPTFKSEIHGAKAVLPPEVWTDIFHHVRNDALSEAGPTLFLPPYGLSTVRAAKLHLVPVVLSQVCRYWNGVITSNPLFWTRIFVHMESRYPEEQLRTWLERSGSMLVSIFVDAHDMYRNYRQILKLIETFQKCVKILHRNAPRVQNLSFTLSDTAVEVWTAMLQPAMGSSERLSPQSDHECLNMDFRSLQAVDASTMERVILTLTVQGLTAQQNLVSQICSHASAITSLRFWNRTPLRWWPVLQPQISAHPSIAGIRNLTLKGFEIHDLLSFSRDLSQLHHLRVLWMDCVEFCDFDLPDESRPVRFALQSIHTLRFTASATYGDLTPFSSWSEQLLRCISTPNLASLEVDNKVVASLGWSALTDMLVASRCVIRALTLISDNESFRYWHLDYISSHVFSELEELTFIPRSWTKCNVICLLDGVQDLYSPVVIGDLFTRQITPLTLPRLKRLVLYDCDVEDGVLGHIARTRMLDGTLEYFYAEVKGLHHKTHPVEIEAFKELRRRGYKAYIERTPQMSRMI